MALITIVRPIAGEFAPAARRRSRRGRVAIAALLVAVVGVTATVTEAVASPSTGSTTAVSFVPLSPKVLFTSKAFAAHQTASPIVLGSTTGVPTNATTIQLKVTASGAVAGTMSFAPTGNGAAPASQGLSWAAGKTVTGTIDVNVGVVDEVTFANGAGASTASASIIGYSTQVTSGDINGSGGTTGQVLTDTGAGAAWQSPATALPPTGTAGGALTGTYPNPTLAANSVNTSNLVNNTVTAGKISGSGGTAGQVLTNTGSGSSWQSQPTTTASPWTYATNPQPALIDESNLWTVTLTVPSLTAAVIANCAIDIYVFFGGNVDPLPYTASAGSVFSTLSYQLLPGEILITRFTSDNSGSIEIPLSLQYRWTITTP